MDRLEALGRVPLFRGLSQRQRRRILKGTLDYRFGPGKELVREGEHGETLFVILEGAARVVRRGRTVARLRAGDFLGEVAVLDGRPRTASVVADPEARCLVLHRDELREVLAEEPRIAWAMLGALAGRLRGD
jgi:CRP-like cAMP-binding protein